MTGRGINRLGHAGGRAIAPAVIGGAQERSALHHLARNPDLGLPRVETVVAAGTPWILQRAAGALDPGMLLIPVGGPLPDIAGHVVEAVTVRLERSDGSGPFVT